MGILFKSSVSLLFITLVTGCATTGDGFTRIQPGMSKAEVLEIAGNPARTGRKHLQDRWVYKGSNGEFYVYFSDGIVTYMDRQGDSKVMPDKGFKDLKVTPENTQPQTPAG